MEFRILGPLEVLDDRGAVPLPRGRGRALLALLILHAGQAIPAERLVDELWGDAAPPTVHTALQGLVSSLRKRLEPGRGNGAPPTVLRTEPHGYVLDIAGSCVDAHRFRELLEQAEHARPADRAVLLRDALDLWRGPVLAEFSYQPFAQHEIAALEELRLSATEERIDADLALGRHTQLVAELEALAGEHPFRERLRGQLMLALYRAGRQAEALDAYQSARRTLVEELGVEPGPQLRRLEQAILRQDPSVDAPGSTSRTVAPERTRDQRSWLARQRKLVTILSVSVTPDTASEMDPEALERATGHARGALTGVITKHGGTAEQAASGEHLGLFGVPTAHEDDPLRAARAAVELREALAAGSETADRRLPVRIGIETGEIVVSLTGQGQPASTGSAVVAATRLQRAAVDGDVLVGATARRLLRESTVLEPVVPARDAPLTWRLVDLVAGAPAVARRLDAPLVGRTAELAHLHGAFQQAVRRNVCRRVAVVGDPGIGKSRIARELTAVVGTDARSLTGHCLAYGEGLTFRPLREVVRQAAGGDGRDALARLLREHDDGEWIAGEVAAAIGLTDRPGRPDELFPAFRRLFEAVAAAGPLIVVLEDLHWAEPTLLDLVEYLTGRARGPILLLCLARPELAEQRPTWTEEADALVLPPLGQAETEQLVTGRAEEATLPADALARVLESAQGNPLFAEQLVAAFEHEGTVTVPDSVQTLLAARLDRLGPGERDLLRCAAVPGGDVPLDALFALIPDGARPFARRHLATLERRELVQQIRDGLRFRHVLIQRAAYQSMTRADRALLHERFADWLRSEAVQPPPENDEIVGYHLEQAVAHRRRMGIDDERTGELALGAGEHLAAAGISAFARVRDMAAAANLASRARSLLPASHPQRRAVMDVLADVHPPLGRHDETSAVLTELLDDALTAGDRRRELVVRLRKARIRLDTRADDVDAIRAEAEHALDEFAAAGDDGGMAQAAYLLAQVHRMVGDTSHVAAVARRGLPHADRSGLVRAEIGLRYALSWAAQAGEMPALEGIALCEQLAWRGGTLHPAVHCDVAVLRAMRGEADTARGLVADAREHFVERMRVRRPLMFVARYAAEVEVLSGDQQAAEHELRLALRMALDMGEQDYLAQTAAELSRVLTVLGRLDEADRLASLAREHAPPKSVAQALWRGTKAMVLARLDRPAEAERLALEAVDLAPTGMPNVRADLLVGLAELLIANGRADAATPMLDAAIGLYERKGNIVAAARAHSLSRR